MSARVKLAIDCAIADLEGLLPDADPSGDRAHPAWRTLAELRRASAALPKTAAADGGPDRAAVNLDAMQDGDSASISCAPFLIAIKRNDVGISVDIYAAGDDGSEPIAEAVAYDDQAGGEL